MERPFYLLVAIIRYFCQFSQINWSNVQESNNGGDGNDASGQTSSAVQAVVVDVEMDITGANPDIPPSNVATEGEEVESGILSPEAQLSVTTTSLGNPVWTCFGYDYLDE